MNRIAVIIPAYNAARTIEACLGSIARQTRVPDEVIVVDDGSQDTTLLIVGRHPSKPRIIKDTHFGAPHARNRGAKEASSDLLFFCDADVVLEPFALERLEQLLNKNPQSSFSYGAFRRWDGGVMGGGSYEPQRLQKQNFISTMALIRTRDFPGFDESLKRFQDWDLWLSMLAQKKYGVGTNDILHTVTQPGMISRGAWSRARGILTIRRKHQLRPSWADLRGVLIDSIHTLWHRTSPSSF